MENSLYLFSAFSLTWLIIFLYIYSIFRRQNTLEIKIDKIKAILKKNLDA
ncbi:MAG: CcmD family protein [bacterium]